ncbi:hypothetical protein [Pseudomonas frederiksbergensis]|uniref:Uncharacterized protein n=1 Tax=Pseudomonas frederiksbergensis TaxID=104087 RepID=A0A6L5C513_9PSED|nr:hypothetical protein [Pseudomonas frederiksbergensis]KAF2395275.1 hypothetical protein FX983_03259 [Pseudomonas frederiksbergensis]
MIAWLFSLLAVLGVTMAYLLKIRLSGDNLNHVKLCLGLAFNAIFIISYMDIIENNKYPFLGYRPDIILDNPFIGWVAFVSIFLHSFACPVKWEVKFWLSKK